jgi:two-component system response regulator
MQEQPSLSACLLPVEGGVALPLVLFAEDDDEDWLLIEEALADCEAPLQVERVCDGVALMARLAQQPDPALVMLDLRMPKKDGAEVLREIRQDPRLRHLPVVVMTTSKLDSDIFQSYWEGANSYVVKPVTFDLMAKALHDLHHYWTKVVQLPKRVV